MQSVSKAVDGLSKSAESAGVTWKEFVSERMGSYMKELGGHGPAIRQIAAEWKEYKASIESAGSSSTQTASAFQAVKRATDELGVGLSDAVNQAAQFSSGTLEVKKSSGEMSSALLEASAHSQSFGAGLTDQIPKAVTFGEQIEGASTKFTTLALSVERTMSIMDRYDLTQMSVENAQTRLTKAQDAYNEAVAKYGANSDQALSALQSLDIATNKMEATNIRATSSYVLMGVAAVEVISKMAVFASSGTVVATITGTLTTLWAGLAGAAVGLGTAVAGAYTGMVAFATSGTVIATLSAGVTTAFAAMSGAASAFGAVLLANPVALALAAIVVAVIALKYAWDNNWGGIQEKTERAVSAIMTQLDKIPIAADLVRGAGDVLEYAASGWGAAWDALTGKTNENTKALGVNQSAMGITLNLLSDSDKALYNYYAAGEKVVSLEKRMADMLKEEQVATDNYNTAITELNATSAKEAELAEKVNRLVAAGLTDTPMYTAAVRDHDKAKTDLTAAQNKTNDAEEKYAQYRDQAVKDTPAFKMLVLETAQAYKEAAIEQDKANTKSAEGAAAQKKMGDSVSSVSSTLNTVGIPSLKDFVSNVGTMADEVPKKTLFMADGTIRSIRTMKDGTLLTMDSMRDGTIVKTKEMTDGSSVQITRMKDGTLEMVTKTKEGVATETTLMGSVSVENFKNMNVDSVSQTTTLSKDVIAAFDKTKTESTQKAKDLKKDVTTEFTGMKTDSEDITGAMNTSWLGSINRFVGIGTAGMKDTTATVNNGMSGVVGAVSAHSAQMPPIYDSAWTKIQSSSATYAAKVKAAVLTSVNATIAAAQKKYNDWQAAHPPCDSVECDSCAVDDGGYRCTYDCASDNNTGGGGGCNSYSSDCWGGGGCDNTPTHAEGGIATKATRGIFGEAGPEALIPLPNYLKDLGEGKTTGSSHTTIININAPIYGIDDLNKAIDSALKQVQRNIKSMGG